MPPFDINFVLFIIIFPFNRTADKNITRPFVRRKAVDWRTKGRVLRHEKPWIAGLLTVRQLLSGGHFRPKSAGMSPHERVSHCITGTRKGCVLSHVSARRMMLCSCAVRALCSNLVLHCAFLTHVMAVKLSL